jgi:pyruvate dehydrogenase E1 component alpha subunit
MAHQTKEMLTARKLKLAREVLQLRYWQHLINEDMKKKKFNIPIHVAIGNEAIAVAVCNIMQSEDQLVVSHRNMEYNLTRRGSLEPIYQEYQLLPTGVAGGKLGSMNLAQPDLGIMYASSILGNNMPVASGLALGMQTLGKPGIVIVLTGDGAIEEGTFYEGLVFSKSHHLPLLIIIENNDHSMSSTIIQRRCPISMADMCQAVDIPFLQLSSNNVWEYYEVLRSVRQTVAQTTPVCVEVLLRAMTNHSGPTPGWPEDPKKMSLENGLLVERTAYDPLFVLEELLPPLVMAEMTQQIRAQKRDGALS